MMPGAEGEDDEEEDEAFDDQYATLDAAADGVWQSPVAAPAPSAPAPAAEAAGAAPAPGPGSSATAGAAAVEDPGALGDGDPDPAARRLRTLSARAPSVKGFPAFPATLADAGFVDLRSVPEELVQGALFPAAGACARALAHGAARLPLGPPPLETCTPAQGRSRLPVCSPPPLKGCGHFETTSPLFAALQGSTRALRTTTILTVWTCALGAPRPSCRLASSTPTPRPSPPPGAPSLR